MTKKYRIGWVKGSDANERGDPTIQIIESGELTAWGFSSHPYRPELESLVNVLGHHLIWISHGIIMTVNDQPIPDQYHLHATHEWCDGIIVDKSCTLDDFELVVGETR